MKKVNVKKILLKKLKIASLTPAEQALVQGGGRGYSRNNWHHMGMDMLERTPSRPCTIDTDSMRCSHFCG